MQTIIAPTDFSSISINAVNYAANMALSINAKLILLHVIQLPVMATEVPVSEEIDKDLTDEAKNEMKLLVKKLMSVTGSKIKIESITVVGFFEQQIKATCTLNKPFAVVMATKGAGAVSHLFFGSNTVFAVKHLKCPVLIVPDQAKFNGIKHIVLGSDLKEVSETVHFQFIKNLATIFNPSIDIVSVTKNDGAVHSEQMTGAISFQTQLEHFHPRLHFIKSDNIANGVMDFVNKNDSDLLILIPKKHGFLQSMFHKSQSKTFILHPHIPILCIGE